MDVISDNQNWSATLQSAGVVRDVSAGGLILFQGETAKQIGIIICGHASARVNTERGEETWVGRFETNDFLGHVSLLTQAPIDFEIRAESDAKILFIPAKAFETLLSTDKSLSLTLARDLAARLSVMTNRLVEAVTLSSPGRVCAELLRLSHPVGIDPETLIIRPTPVFIELALRISSTRETVSRTVSQLQKNGILSREPGALLILKPSALQSKVR